MSKQQLIDFVIRKGDEYKREQCENAIAVTKEAQDQLPGMIASLHRIQVTKQAKVDQLLGQKKNFDIEVSGLEIASEALKAKIKKRTSQQHESEA